jgi:phospholipid-binding lipoprotein MlaA
VFGRFVINSTLGVFGFGDAAAEAFDIQPRNADFGETLGVYGVGEGVFLNWPFFGPSNIRDSVGFVADMQLHPYNYLDVEGEELFAARSLEFVNRLSLKGDAYEEMKRISVDPYVATRQAYSDYRRSLIKSHKK